MKRRQFLKTTALATMFGTVVAASVQAQSTDPVRIGYSMALTGIFSQAAPSQVNAYELWAEQVNAEGGLEIAGGERRMVEFVSYDDQSNPGNAVRIYEKLITQDKVDLLAAPWGTPMHLAIAPVLQRYKMPMLGNTAASVKLRELEPGYIWFPTSAIPDSMGRELALFLKAEGVTSVAVLANELPYSQEVRTYLIPALEAQGIDVKVDQSYPPDVKDMTSVLVDVKAKAPGAVIALSYPADSFLFAGQAKELGIDAPFVMSLVGPTFDSYRKAFGPSVNGVVTAGHWSASQSDWPRAMPFFDAYLAKYGEEPDALDSALSYMSLEILQQAVAEAGLDHEMLRDAISTGTFETINGDVSFDGVQNAMTPTSWLQIQDGSLQIVWPDAVKTADFVPKTGW